LITPLSAATEGLIDDRTPLSVATRGLIKLPVEVSEVVIVQRKHGKMPPRDRVLIPFPWEFKPIKLDIKERKKPGVDIRKDDNEILNILIELITGGYLN
jgi:hypothetical protein